MDTTLGKRMINNRKKLGLTQDKLAEALGVTAQAVSKWENDLSSPDTIHLIQIAEILDTEVEYLATGRKPVYEEPPIVLNMVKKVDRVVEKVVEKPVIRKVIRVKYLRNPIEYALCGIVCFLLGILIGSLL